MYSLFPATTSDRLSGGAILGPLLLPSRLSLRQRPPRDRGKKRRLYLEAGVEEYWIVDIDAKLIERWHAGDDRPEIVEDVLRWELSVGCRVL